MHVIKHLLGNKLIFLDKNYKKCRCLVFSDAVNFEIYILFLVMRTNSLKLSKNRNENLLLDHWVLRTCTITQRNIYFQHVVVDDPNWDLSTVIKALSSQVCILKWCIYIIYIYTFYIFWLRINVQSSLQKQIMHVHGVFWPYQFFRSLPLSNWPFTNWKPSVVSN